MRGRYGDSKSLSVLTVSAVAGQIRATFDGFEDRRRGKNTPYSLSDAALSAFSVFSCRALPSWTSRGRCRKHSERTTRQRCSGCIGFPVTIPFVASWTRWRHRQPTRCSPSFLTACNRRGSWIATGRRGSACCWRSMEWSIFPREISTVRDAQRVLMGTAPLIPTRRLSRFWSVPDETKSSPDLRSSSFPRTVMRNKTVKSTPRGVGWSERGRAMRPGTSRFSVTICTAMSRIAAICWRVDSSSFWSANPLRTRCCMSG